MGSNAAVAASLSVAVAVAVTGKGDAVKCRAAQSAEIPDAKKKRKKKRVFLLDVHPLCYTGDRPDPMGFIFWMEEFFVKIAHDDAIVAVFDGANGNDFRKKILPAYKARRKKYNPLHSIYKWTKGHNIPDIQAAFPPIHDFFKLCNIPVVKLDDAEADDVMATLTEQAVAGNTNVVIASPDKDLRQLLSHKVQLVMPIRRRWSFYTVEQYIEEHKCEPSIELGLRCMLGDATDGVVGLTDVAPNFGRKTALKLMRKHGSIKALTEAAAVRTVGKPYIHDALTQHAAILQTNLQVLSLRRDITGVLFEGDWCLERDKSNDDNAFNYLHTQFNKRFLSQKIL